MRVKFTRQSIFLTFSWACRLLLLLLLLASGGLAAQSGAQLIHAEVSRGRARSYIAVIFPKVVHRLGKAVDGLRCRRAR